MNTSLHFYAINLSNGLPGSVGVCTEGGVVLGGAGASVVIGAGAVAVVPGIHVTELSSTIIF